MAFYETSAKDKSMVDEAFFALTRDIKKRLGEHPGPNKSTGTVQASSHSLAGVELTARGAGVQAGGVFVCGEEEVMRRLRLGAAGKANMTKL